jgi:hypothetical protein
MHIYILPTFKLLLLMVVVVVPVTLPTLPTWAVSVGSGGGVGHVAGVAFAAAIRSEVTWVRGIYCGEVPRCCMSQCRAGEEGYIQGGVDSRKIQIKIIYYS